ncbi:plasmid pRiA4b ORF-3 family protein [Nitrobacter sp. TKz-YC01]
MSLSTTAVRIKVTLKDVKPEVMRRLVVPFTLRLDRLHLTLQAAFDWTDSHLFAFTSGDEHWGIPDLYDDFGPLTSGTAGTTSSNWKSGSTTRRWMVCRSCSTPSAAVLQKMLAACRAMRNISEAIDDPTHPKHESMRIWGPERFDPNVIDRKATSDFARADMVRKRMHQLTIAIRARNLASHSAVSSLASPARQPDFITL